MTDPFGQWLKGERERRGWKAEEVARRLRDAGYEAKDSSYRVWESGRRPRAATVAALERMFGSPAPAATQPTDNMAALVGLVTLQTEELKRLWEVQSQTVAALTKVAESLTILATEMRSAREEAPEWALAALQLARSLGPVEPSDEAPSEPRVSAAPRRRRR